MLSRFWTMGAGLGFLFSGQSAFNETGYSVGSLYKANETCKREEKTLQTGEESCQAEHNQEEFKDGKPEANPGALYWSSQVCFGNFWTKEDDNIIIV
jgi:hypothetical protein